MSALTSLLARDAVVPVEEIEAALQRQVLEGGEIDTALLELGAAEENTLNAYRAAAYGLQPASREDVMRASSDAIERLPRELAHALRVVPIGVHDAELSVAAAKPLSPEDQQELERATGFPIACRIAVAVRVETALAVYYGIEITGRMRMLGQRLDDVEPGPLPLVVGDGQDPSSGLGAEFMGAFDSEPPSGEVAALAPPPEPTAEHAGPEAHREPESTPAASVVAVAPVVNVASYSELPPAGDVQEPAGAPQPELPRAPERVPEPGPPPLSSAPVLSAAPSEAPVPVPETRGEMQDGLVLPASRGGRSRSRPALRRPRVSSAPKGPMSPQRAQEMLEQASDRDAVLDVFFSFARQYFYGAALFAVRDEHAIGLECYGMGAALDIESLSVPIRERSALADIIKTRATRVVDLTRREADGEFVAAIARQHTQPSALVPVCIRQRLVALLYGDRDGEPFRVDELADLIEMLPSVVRAFERIIRARKLFARQVRDRHSRPPPPMQAEGDSGQQEGAEPSPHAVAASDAGAQGPQAGQSQAVEPTPRSTLQGVAHTAAKAAAAPAGALGSQRPAPPMVTEPPAAPEKRAALESLGVPRSAPPPPEPEAHKAERGAAERPTDLESQPTLRLQRAPEPEVDEVPPPTNPRAPAPRSTKPPPGTGAYSHTLPTDARTPKADRSDKATTQRISPRSRASQPSRPARADSLPPATDTEDSGLRPLPEGRPSGEAGAYRLEAVSTEVLSSRPPPPAAPAPSGQPVRALTAEDRAQRRASDAASTQPVTPRSRRRAAQPDDRAEQGERGVDAEIVQLPTAMRDALKPPSLDQTRPDAKAVTATEGEQPSIIVDMGGDIVNLVDDLCGGGPDDEGPIVDHLLRLGEQVLPELLERFPGPLWFDRYQPYKRLPRGEDVSAVCRALSSFGSRAAPYLAPLLGSTDPDVRFYATLLAADRVEPALMEPIAARLLDPDPKIRLIAMDVFPAYRDLEGFEALVAGLRERAADRSAPLDVRMAALDGLAVVRDPGSLEVLLLLKTEERQLSVPAHRALVAITGQDFGDSNRKWTAWYKRNQGRHRIEWLIDSLMHSDERVRSIAGLELQKLTRVYYGFAAGAGKKDRERAQTRYRKWWASEGLSRFTG